MYMKNLGNRYHLRWIRKNYWSWSGREVHGPVRGGYAILESQNRDTQFLVFFSVGILSIRWPSGCVRANLLVYKGTQIRWDLAATALWWKTPFHCITVMAESVQLCWSLIKCSHGNWETGKTQQGSLATLKLFLPCNFCLRFLIESPWRDLLH